MSIKSKMAKAMAAVGLSAMAALAPGVVTANISCAAKAASIAVSTARDAAYKGVIRGAINAAIAEHDAKAACIETKVQAPEPEVEAEPEVVYVQAEPEVVYVQAEPEVVYVQTDAPSGVSYDVSSVPTAKEVIYGEGFTGSGTYGPWFSVPCPGADEAPADGSLGQWARHWYIAHDGTYYGNQIHTMCENDIVEVDGYRVSIDGVGVFSLTQPVTEITDVTGNDAWWFQVCNPEGGTITVVWGHQI